MQRVDRRVESHLSDAAGEDHRRVEVREDGCRSRVGQVIGGHIDRLHARDGAVVRRHDAFFERSHLRRQRGLVAHLGRDARAKQRYLETRLNEAVDVVEEQQDVRVLDVPEVLGGGQRAVRKPETCARRFVHLGEVEHRTFEHLGALHLKPQVVALARALADSAEDTHSFVDLPDVAYQLHDHDGLTHPRTPE